MPPGLSAQVEDQRFHPLALQLLQATNGFCRRRLIEALHRDVPNATLEHGDEWHGGNVESWRV